MEINSAINLDSYKTNSLIIAKLPENSLSTPELADNLRRNLADLKIKLGLDDSVTLWATEDDIELRGYDEKEMASLGWVRKDSE